MKFISPWARPISVRLDSADVLHEFWVPELARKITTVPGPSESHLAGGRQARNLSRRVLGILRHRACLDALSRRRARRPRSSRHGKKRNSGRRRHADRRAAAQGLGAFPKHELRQLPRDQRHRGAGAQVGPDLTHFASRRQFGGRHRGQYARESPPLADGSRSRLSRA